MTSPEEPETKQIKGFQEKTNHKDKMVGKQQQVPDAMYTVTANHSEEVMLPSVGAYKNTFMESTQEWDHLMLQLPSANVQNEDKISQYMLEAPITSYTDLLTAQTYPEEFDNHNYSTENSIEVPVEDQVEEHSRLSDYPDIQNSELTTDDQNEDTWDIDLFKNIDQSQEQDIQQTSENNRKEDCIQVEDEEIKDTIENSEYKAEEFITEEDIDNFLESERLGDTREE
ncbi:hypothetical protein ACP70R_023026 [Stipagrostis hirtigluma subsp. patula]